MIIMGWTASRIDAYRHASIRRSPPPRPDARVAQLVEHAIENRSVGGSNPSPGTICSHHLEIVGKSSNRRSSKRCSPTSPLHNGGEKFTITPRKSKGYDSDRCYTKLLHKMPPGMCFRGGQFYLRRRIPNDVRGLLGRSEIWRSLRTDSLKCAVRRFSLIVSQVEAEFESVYQ